LKLAVDVDIADLGVDYVLMTSIRPARAPACTPLVYFLFLFPLSLHLAEALGGAVEAGRLAGSSTSDIVVVVGGGGGGGEAIAMRGASRVTVIDLSTVTNSATSTTL
jgi:hypothetical protein